MNHTICPKPGCGQKLRFGDTLRGKRVKCPKCSAAFEIPAGPQPLPASCSPPLQSPVSDDVETIAIATLVEDPENRTPGGLGKATAASKLLPEDDSPYRLQDESHDGSSDHARRPCPFCGEEILAIAKKCKHCGEWLTAGEKARRQVGQRLPVSAPREFAPHRGGLILTLGIFSFFCFGIILGPAAWAMGNRDLLEMEQGRMDPRGQGMTQAGKVCGILGTIGAALVLLIMCGGGLSR